MVELLHGRMKKTEQQESTTVTSSGRYYKCNCSGRYYKCNCIDACIGFDTGRRTGIDTSTGSGIR